MLSTSPSIPGAVFLNRKRALHRGRIALASQGEVRAHMSTMSVDRTPSNTTAHDAK